ncbi:Bifunctional protein FolD-Methylenetetrahydrofolate dehydrogenase-Methenyltetrahydrofolate cyclohydrolase [Moritella viscosa]|uniref:hypothetical protein n=1 Tax=Moritella viscosa TaxID=80854 RepID=UPI0005091DB3|nr:hypothetical protein [Moritella viscosa]CED62256.1 putative uncharacterized protein [Moritella viscosa]SHO08916.1 Bifunctional protein FolD-Methylenetetrahydrofolate dehydrogenase-Methenyltetrahydrofolate cyclohydrolase [Moritella viscosa]SHO22277.1 Bifunctional protein FolD-Methylenetetrahydrofolate dehydrogenase-Methenyltetrahydrofolate cyclohydrolase [Moritella viscosa]
MKKNIKNELFLAVSNEIMNTKHSLHKHLLNFDSNPELKVFLAILAKATMIFKANESTEKQTFSTVGFLSDDSFLPKSINLKKLTKIIEEMNNPFFEHLEITHKTVCFKLSNEYTKSTLKKGFSKINLMSLKPHKDLKTTKLAILTALKPNGYLNLNYVLECLKVNKKLERTEQIRQVKKAFKKLKDLGLLECVYKYPVNKNVEVLPEHYKFHYKAIIKDNDTFKEADVEIKSDETPKEKWKLSKQEIDEIEIKETIKQRDKKIDETFNGKDFDLNALLADIKKPNPVEVKNNDDELHDIPF